MSKAQQKINFKLFSLIGAVVAILGFAGYVVAFGGNSYGSLNIQNANINLEAPSDSQLGQIFGSTTRGDWNVEGDLTVLGTTTLEDIVLGSKYSTSLTLSATSTTPGAAGVLTNSGSAKICSSVAIDITTGSTAGGRLGSGSPFAISAATSTAAGVGNGANLIATTTVATSTTPLLDSINDKGSYATTAGQLFVWGASEVIQVSFDGITDDPATSTAALTLAGKAYVVCHDR